MEGTECCERAILPEKALREKLNTVIEDEFSKVALRNTIKYFKPHSENDCVGAAIKVLEYSLTKNEVPKPYQRDPKRLSSQQLAAKLLTAGYQTFVDIFKSRVRRFLRLWKCIKTHTGIPLPDPINVRAPFLSLHQITTTPSNRICVQPF